MSDYWRKFASMLKKISKEQLEQIQYQVLEWIQEGQFDLVPPFGGIHFSKYNASFLEYTAIVPNVFGGWFPYYYNRLTNLQKFLPGVDRRGHIINLINNNYRNFFF